MLKASLCAAALTTGMVSLACAQQWGANAPSTGPLAAVPRAEAQYDASRVSVRERADDSVITHQHIVRLRAALRLTPAQLPHWLPVEVALYELARQQARGEAAAFTYRMSDRSSAVATTAAQLRRIKAIAMPLIRTLDDHQKREAIAFARHMGFEQLVASF